MDNKNSQILVTGGTGFLGAYIIQSLFAKGYSKVSGIHRSSSSFDLLGNNKDKIKWFEADLGDRLALETAIEDADIVIHSAALISFDSSDFQRLIDTNVKATGQLIDLCLENQIQHFIYVSSVAAFARGKISEEISEANEWSDSKWNTDYGVSKHFAEREIWRGMAEGLNVNILNPSYIIGAGYWSDGPTSIYEKIRKGLSFYPKGTNGLVDVRDVAEMIVKIMKSKLYGEQFISNAENVSHQHLFSEIASNFGMKAPSIMLNPFLGDIAVFVEKIKTLFTRKKSIISRKTIMISNQILRYDNSKSREMLGFEYRHWKESIKEICACYLESEKNKKPYGILKINNL